MNNTFSILTAIKLFRIGVISLLLFVACKEAETGLEQEIEGYLSQIDEASEYQASFEQEYLSLNRIEEICKRVSIDCSTALLAKGILRFKEAHYDSALLLFDQHQETFEESTEEEYEQKLRNYYRAASYTFKGAYEKARPILLELLKNNEKNSARQDSVIYARALFTLGVGYSNPALGKLDSAIVCLKRVGQLQEDLYGDKCEQLGKTQNFLAQAFLLLQACDSSEHYYRKAIDNYQHLPKDKQFDLWVSYNGLASVLIAGFCKRTDYAQALNLLHRAVSISNSLPENNPNKNAPFATRGRLYQAIGDYYSAIENYQLALPDDQQHPNYPILLSNIGAAFASMEDYPEAISYFRSALAYPKAGGIFRAFWLNNLATAYIGLENVDSAVIYLNKARAFEPLISKVFQSEATEFHALFYTNHGELYRKLEDYPMAESYYEKALQVRQESQDANISLTYQKLGEVYRAQEKPEQAFTYYHKGLASIGLTEDQIARPDPTALDNNMLQRPFYLLLSSLAKNWELKYKLEESQNDLRKAYETYGYSLQLVDSMLSSFRRKGSKLALIQDALPLYEGAFRTAKALLDLSGNKDYANSLYELSEKNKSIVLKQALQEKYKMSFWGVADTLIKREEELGYLLASHQSSKPGGPSADSLKASFLRVRNELEKKSPAFYRFKYKNEINGLEEFQEKLRSDSSTALIYQSGKENLLLLLVQGENIHTQMIPIPLKKLDSLIYAFRKAILSSDIRKYVQTASLLYQKLLEPIVPLIENRRLLIIPDGPLSQLPFEALAIEADSIGVQDYTSFHFAIEQYQISYAYSASLFMDSSSPQSSDNSGILAIAPFDESVSRIYEDLDEKGIAALPYVNRLLHDELDTYQGELYEGMQAKKELITQDKTAYKIIHFGSHARLNLDEPILSSLYFAPQKTSGGEWRLNNIQIKDIYKLNLNADLLILGACSSGESVQGAGKRRDIYTLAHAFSYAGCPSIIMTQFEVPDIATPEILHEFYSLLGQGLSKDAALRNAKLSFLQDPKPGKRNPRNWAGLALLGKREPVFVEKRSSWSKIFNK